MRPHLATGARLGRFELTKKLAIGGMAEIWAAREVRADGKEVSLALKILLPQFCRDPAFRAMFSDEVSIATRLTHQNIVQVYGAHEDEGRLFQSMELIEGSDLRRFLSQTARARELMPVPLALLVAREVARGLSYAHHRRSDDGRPLEIVHRDVSPHNVMIARSGRVKLLDFGIARAAERLSRTRTGVVKGKIPYMAPEQALNVGVTPQTDIFSTGVVLWEMLAMRRLFFAATDDAIVDLVVKANAADVREHNAEVPEEAAELVARMLKQRALHRPESMRDVENALTRILSRNYPPEASTEAELAAWAAPILVAPQPTAVLTADDDGVPPPVEPEKMSGAERERSEVRMERQESQEVAVPTDGQDVTEPSPVVHRESDGEPGPEFDSFEGSSPTISMLGPPSGAVNATPTPVMDPTAVTPSQNLTYPIPTRTRGGGGRNVEDLEVANTVATPMFGATPSDATPRIVDSSSGEYESVRAPTQSEIVRAIDMQPTIPVQADPRFAAPPQRVEVVSADSGQVESPIRDPASGRGPMKAEPVALPVAKPLSRAETPEPSLTDDPVVDRFEPISVGLETPVIRPKAPVEPTDPELASPPPRPSRLLPMVTLALACVVVLLLLLLLLRD